MHFPLRLAINLLFLFRYIRIWFVTCNHKVLNYKMAVLVISPVLGSPFIHASTLLCALKG